MDSQVRAALFNAEYAQRAPISSVLIASGQGLTTDSVNVHRANRQDLALTELDEMGRAGDVPQSVLTAISNRLTGQ